MNFCTNEIDFVPTIKRRSAVRSKEKCVLATIAYAAVCANVRTDDRCGRKRCMRWKNGHQRSMDQANERS